MLGFFALFAVLIASLMAGARADANFFAKLWLVTLALAMAVSGVAGGLTAAVAIVRKRERSVLVFVALLWGLFVLSWVIAELLGDHWRRGPTPSI